MDLPYRLYKLGWEYVKLEKSDVNSATLIHGISALERARDLLPDTHAARPALLTNLGIAVAGRAGRTGDESDLATARCYLKSAAESGVGPPHYRIKAAGAWATLIKARELRSPEILAAYEVLITLLGQVAGLDDTIQGRHKELQETSGKASEAACAACELQCPKKAVEWLEQGHCLVWNQLSRLRTPLDDLRQHDGRLVQRIKGVSKALETAGATRELGHPDMAMSEKITIEDAAREHLALAREWDNLLAQARSLPGFESFLLPSSFDSISKHLPTSGAVVIINVHTDRCDAIALVANLEEPLHIPLPDFSFKKADEYRGSLRKYIANGGPREQGGEFDRALGTFTQQSDITTVLRGLWTRVVKPIFDELAISKSDESSEGPLPRIWWCPTGPLSFLPLHAAGVYGGNRPESILDYVVSSYTPTVTALTDRVEKQCSVDEVTPGLFLTSQPKAPGAAFIRGTTTEVRSVYAMFTEKGVAAEKVEGGDMSIDECLAKMEKFSSIHLACHASQNSTQPLSSRFLFHNGHLDLSDITQRNLKNADLAFLSACQTSTGGEMLPDEAVHLAAGMMAAGYQRVVATMWAIADQYAPGVANDFYEFLLNQEGGNSGFSGALSAHALHHAVQKLRKRLGDSKEALLIWTPYVHFGY